MKQKLLFFKMFAVGVLLLMGMSAKAVTNNVELIANGTFTTNVTPAQAVNLNSTFGVWYSGDNTKGTWNTLGGFIADAATGAFVTTTGVALTNAYENFLGQITSDATVNSGRYHISVNAKGDQPFYIKISAATGTAPSGNLGTELSYVLKNASSSAIEKQAIVDYSSYSLKITPTGTATTYTADLDITNATPSAIRILIVFPKVGAVTVDDISLKRTADIPSLTTFFIRPYNTTLWDNTAGVDASQIITCSSATNTFPAISSTNTYYIATGTYTTGSISVTTQKLYGGFSGLEAEVNLNNRILSDKDVNGIIEPWEFSNEVIITTNNDTYKFTGTGSTGGSRILTISGTDGEVNGVTITDFNYTGYWGPISIGKAASTPVVGDNTTDKAGILRYCTVKRLKTNTGGGAVMLTNKYSLIDRCLIENTVTTAANSGGAIFMNLMGGTIRGSVVRNNVAAGGGTNGNGAGIYATSVASTDMDAIVENCVVYNNYATGNGGGIRAGGQTGKRGIQIVNSTIINNKTGSTSATTKGSVELITTGIIVNSIIAGDPSAELRPNTTNNYILNNAYGEFTTEVTPVLYGSGNVSAKVVANFNFVSPTNFTGAMVPDYTTPWDQTKYDAIRAANFSINNATSVAVTTSGVASIPTTYQVGGTGATINNTATVPTTDITGLTRTGAKTLGAYQATHTVASGVTEIISQPTTLASLTVAAGGKLSITNGVAVNIGSLTLESDANGTATMIDSYNTPTVTATVKQYVTAGRNWYVSAPVSNALYSQVTGGDSVVAFNEALKKWERVTADNLIAGKGYIRAAIASSGSTGTVNFNGLANSGNIPVTVTRTESVSSRGFNLVGNPYPSYLNWTSFIADPANVNTGTSFWYRTKNTDGAYVFVTHNGTSGEVIGGTTANTIITNLIPPMQAFWVRVNANSLTTPTTYSTSITFKNDMRDHRDDNGNKLKAPALTERKRLRLQVSNGVNSDESLIYFDAKANDAYDNFDSPKMFNNAASVPEIFTQVGAEKLVMNGLNEVKYDTEIPLGFITGGVNNFTLKTTELKNFDAETRIILKDKLNPGNEFDLSQGESYNFSAGITSASTNRFSLIFRTSGSTTGIENAIKQNTHVFVNTANQIVISSAEKCNYAIYNAVGQLIENGIVNSKLITHNSKLTTGVYVVRVNNQSTRVIIK